MVSKTDRKLERDRRHKRVRTKVSGTAERPRLCVYRSNSNLYAQIIDDVAGNTLVSASTVEADLRGLKNNVADAAKLGEVVGKRLLEKNIDTVVFDRNGYIYHGIVKAIADGARAAGVKF